MKIVFMGTPEFAVPTLLMLSEAGHEIGYAVTQQDKAKDRGKKVQPTPVKAAAQQLNIEVLQPETIKGNSEFYNQLRNYMPDLIVVAAYGKILSKEILELPRYGCVNVHASILPRYRGAAPIQRSILEGEEYTGVTIMRMEEGLDTGDMLAKSRIRIEDKNAEELTAQLSQMGAKLLAETLTSIEDGSGVPVSQDNSLATYAPMIYKSDGLIRFEAGAEAIERQVRGLYPWPGAYTYLNGEIFKIWEAAATEEENMEPDGTITDAGEAGIAISAGGKTLLAMVVQVPGKKRMSAAEYLKGKKIERLTRLG